MQPLQHPRRRRPLSVHDLREVAGSDVRAEDAEFFTPAIPYLVGSLAAAFGYRAMGVGWDCGAGCCWALVVAVTRSE